MIIYGRQPVWEALQAGHPVKSLYLTPGAEARIIKQILEKADKAAIPVKKVNRDALQKLTGPVVSQGLAAEIEPLPIGDMARLDEHLAATDTPFIIVLDQIQDPHNVGAIIRTAEIAGATALVLGAKGSPEINATIVKTSVGAVFHLPLFRAERMDTLIEHFNEENIYTLSLKEGQQTPMYELNLRQPVALVAGNEGAGVRKNISRLCRGVLTIPQFGRIASLNASVATAVAIYEVVRQRRNINPE